MPQFHCDSEQKRRNNEDKKLRGENRTGTIKENRTEGGVGQNKEKEGTAPACRGTYISLFLNEGEKEGNRKT